MKKSYLMIAISMALVQGCYTTPPYQPSSHAVVGAGYPDVNIGIHYSTYPDFVRIPGYPVYYAPRVDSNYFFYDGLYWVFQGDNWYASGWYNGPWDRVGYYDVPVYVLSVPVRYYRRPPPYFRGWHDDAPPRWGEHWGRDWEQRRSGWDRWDRGSAPAPAPLPTYQRNYSGDRYPRAIEQQQAIRSEYYRYQPRDPVAQQYFRPRGQQGQQHQQEQRQQEQRQQDQRQQEQRQQAQRQQAQRQQAQRQQEQRQQEQRQQEQRQRAQRQQEQRQQEQRQQEQRQHEQRQQEQRQQEQRQQEQRQKELQRQKDVQRQKDPQRQKDMQRQQEQQRQKEQKPQQDLGQQRSQPEPKGAAKDHKAAPQDQVQKGKNAQQEYERKKREEEERYQNR